MTPIDQALQLVEVTVDEAQRAAAARLAAAMRCELGKHNLRRHELKVILHHREPELLVNGWPWWSLRSFSVSDRFPIT